MVLAHSGETGAAASSSGPSLLHRFFSCMRSPKLEEAAKTSTSRSAHADSSMSAGGDHNRIRNAGGLERVFWYWDENGDGKISPSELCNGMGEELLSAEEAEKAVQLSDWDGDGQLGLGDFLKLVETSTEESLRDAFRVYDMEGRGCITPKSLRRLLKRLGEDHSLHDCALMIRPFDLNGDGVLSFDEFHTMMLL